MTIHEIRNEIRDRLAPVVGMSEADTMSKMIIEDVKGYTPVELVIHANRELEPETIARIRRIADRVAEGEPLQYVLGKAWWHGRIFTVNPSVLIPRPETSQLVDMIENDHRGKEDLRVLDIGTGSGCIAVTLALDLPFARVVAIDISRQALQTAECNAKALKAKVRFEHIDVFDIDRSSLRDARLDIIVSNPPYILESEREEVDAMVKDHEPDTALFVDDDHSIDIYRKIIGYAATNLDTGGRLYLEINPLCADMIKRALEETGLDDAEIIRDYKGVKRFAKATHR
ncbi:MAG: peptide chain release factor N(5)-glutamine methyltransferase [Muribaculaceae bacterium]|nr:peptide chain release factor N(5)-glutamine methyltransferase [Muribaculaceae bacterium]